MNLTESSGSDDHNHHVGGARTALALTARWRRAQAMLGAVVTASALAGSMVAGAATTTFGVLLDTDNNINSGCTISTADGSFAGVELVLNTTVVANSTGYRVTGITLQSCTGSSLSAPVTLDSAAYPVARGFGANGTSAVETYIPTAYLPQSGLKMRIGLTTSGADGITGADALLSSNGAPILFDAPPPLVVPALSTMALGLTALLLALAVWYARRRGWHGMQLVVVAVFAISLSGQIIAAIVRDGLITDWSGVSALATDPLGDAPAGTDVSALYATYDGPNLYFRIDAALNSPPVANPQSVTAKVGETLNITLTGSDYEGATLSYAVLVPPTQGVLGGTAPNVTYTPNANATASDSFTFKVNDGTLDSATATVSITNTRAPQITSANSAIFIPTQANSFTFASNGMPTPTAAFGGCTPALPSVTFVADANGGGTLSGSPLVSEAGPHTCTFTSTNGVTPNATQSFTLTVGGAPTITSAATVSVPELAPFTHTVTTTSVGLPITGMAQPTGTLPSAVTFTYAGTPAATATVGGTPAVCTRGTYPISLTASNIVGTTTQNFTLTVRPVNQAPSFTAGATVTVNEDSGPQTVAGWATALNKGAPCESAQVLTFEITGNTNSALFSTQPAVNGTNGNLTFTPAPNANGTATITLRVRDDGGVVDGGVDVSATQNFVINVTPVNDAPVLTAGATLAYTENGPAAVIDNTITITDIDSANLVGATVVISGNYQNGQDVLAFVNASGITGNFVAGTGTLTLTGSSSLANYQTALRSVTYVNTSDNPSALTRTVSWTVDDGGATANLSNTATSSINVTPVNDAPVVVAGNTVTYTENSPAIALSPGLTANDVDSANLTATTVQITGNYFNGQDVLSFVNAGGIAGVFSVATGTMTLTGSASVATWQTALRSVAYVNTSENPSTLARTVTWIVNDGAALSLPVTSTVNVVAVNDAPVLTAGATLAFTEGGSAAVVDGTVTVSDVDSVNLTSATVQITANYANGEDVLAFVNAGGITGSFAPATGTLTLTGVATLANYQAALRSVTYNNTSITPSTLARTVTWIGNDGALPSAPVTSTINVIAVNSPPTINSVAPATATEGALYTYGATRIDADGPGQTWSLLGTNTCAGAAIVPATGVYTFTPAGPVPPASCVVAIQVCDGGTPNLCATQTTTVTITPVNDAPVINSTAPTPATEDVAYTYNATRLDPDGPGQTWSLTASNTCAGASIVAGTGVYTYTPVGPTPPASCVIGIQVCDGGTPNLCATQTTTLNITAVNDAPVINSAAPTTATEDTLYTYTATRVDPDGPAQAWSIAGTNTCAGASIVAGTGVYTFTPAGPIPPASCDVGIQVCDNGTPNLCATQTTTVTIIAVNDPPIPTNPGTLAARVHIPVTFPAATLGGTDPDLGVVTIDTVPTSVLAGATVTINADGSFTFSPPAEATGTVVGFAYRVCDNGNPGPGVCSAYQNVSFNLTGPTIYYVKTAAVGSGNCTLTNECTLATALTNIGALTGRTIFISDSAIYTQAVTLNSGGSLYGQGVTGASFDAVFGTSVPPVGAIPARPAINATRPFITSTGVTVALNSNNTVRGLNLTGTAGPTVSGNNFGTLTASDLSITGGLPALSLINGAAAATFDAVSSTGGATGVLLNAVTGTLNINGGAISGATATGFSVIGGTATINNAATVTSGAGARSISVTGKTSGTATFSGAVTDNGTGISLTSNTGGTINFTGVITASTGGNTAFNATGGGTVAATNTASTLTSTTGTALNVTNTTIGAGNLVFRSISVNGATTGINLSSTGSSGGLTVLGNSAGNCGGSVVDKNTVATAPVTADCTGGTIQNAATGIRLDNTANVSLTRMRITGNATHNFGIYATNTTNFSLNRSVIDGTIGVTTGGQDAPLVFGKLDVVGDPGINGLSGTANAITDSWIQGGIEHNVEIYGQSNNFGLAVTRTVVKSNSVGGGADGIQMELQGTAVGRVLVDNSQFDDNKSQAIQAAANGSSTVHFTLQNSRWSKTTQGNEGVVFSNGSNGQLFVDINNNLVPGTPAAGFGGAAIFVGQTPGNATASSRLHATVRNNTVTTPTTATNHTLIAYPTSTVGAGAPGFVRFENNTVTNHGLFNGIIVNTPDAGTNPNFHATVLNNNITHTDSVNAVNPIAINARQSSTACLHIANNAATVPPSTGFVGVRARQVAPALVTLYDVPPAGTTAAFELAANHPTATTEVIGTITLTGVICTSPTAPSAP
ncbi:MAG: Ig-like domain-containing protein [Burkholderiales bacterium]